jgi:hypothetical protein
MRSPLEFMFINCAVTNHHGILSRLYSAFGHWQWCTSVSTKALILTTTPKRSFTNRQENGRKSLRERPELHRPPQNQDACRNIGFLV